jgi:5'-methylthioadenosine phosphorylase
MKHTAFILECELDKKFLARDKKIKVTHNTNANKYGDIRFTNIEYNDEKVVVYERCGMDGIRTLPQSHMPLYTDIYLKGLKSVFILGFCGSLDIKYPVGSVLIPNDFIDYTKNRNRSYLEEIKAGDLFFYRMAEPFSPELKSILFNTLMELKLETYIVDNYIVTEGPRFESSAEVKYFRKLGGKAVCFGGVPDVYFARELNIGIICSWFVSDYGEGIKNSSFKEILNTANFQATKITELITVLLKNNIAISDVSYHDKYWMQKPNQNIYKLIK